MATTQSIVKSSSIRVNLHVNGLGERHLTDTEVGCTAEFYIAGKYADATVQVAKNAMIAEETDSDDLICIVDTTTLSKGSLYALVTVTYPATDDDNAKTITEKNIIDCNISLVEVK